MNRAALVVSGGSTVPQRTATGRGHEMNLMTCRDGQLSERSRR